MSHDSNVLELCDALFGSQITGALSFYLYLIKSIFCFRFHYLLSFIKSLFQMKSILSYLNMSCISADTNYTRILNRREEVAKWLQKYMKSIEQHGKLPPSGPAKILHLLLIGDLENAIQEAVESNYPHLACGLSVFKHTNRAAYKNQVHIYLLL